MLERRGSLRRIEGAGVSIEVRILGSGDEAVLCEVAPGVFDDPIDPRATEAFLLDPNHHLAVAIDAGMVVGFASGVHYVHPDKPSPELWVNAVGVAFTHRGREIAKATVSALLERARQLGCAEAWVLTDGTNTAALRL